MCCLQNPAWMRSKGKSVCEKKKVQEVLWGEKGLPHVVCCSVLVKDERN